MLSGIAIGVYILLIPESQIVIRVGWMWIGLGNQDESPLDDRSKALLVPVVLMLAKPRVSG